MADPRTFVLIGNFTDNITPALEKINNSISKLKTNISSLSSVTKPLKSDFRDLASLSKDFNTSLKGQAADIKSITAALKAYRNEMGRVNRSYKAGGSRLMRQAAAAAPIPPQPPRPPRVPRTPAPTGRGGGGSYAAAVGGGVLGSQLANTISGAIVSGFQIGVGIMEKPFRYFAQALGERIDDEISDLKTAGAYFAIAKRQKDPFVTTMDDAIQYTQQNNLVMAKLAAALPGSTRDYVEVSKRLSDTIARVVGTDLAGAVKEANRIRATTEGAKYYGAQPISPTAGKQASQQAITTLLGELTKKTVLAGFGGRAGAGGAMGAYGLPGLSERMISQASVSMGQFQRYSAIFSDPQIMDALARNIENINKTAANSVERFKAVNKMYDEVLPPELVEKFRRSIKGINEALKSAAIDPELGFLGIGRKLEGLGRRLNDFGQYVDETGKVVQDVNQAAKMNLSIFDMLRDIYAQTAQVLVPIVEVLPQLWDPLKKIGLSLSDARHYTAEFLKSFNSYRDGLKEFAKTLSGEAQLDVMKTLDIRASMAAINNLFAQFGVYGKDADKEFNRVAQMLKDPKLNIADLLSEMINKLFTSDIAKKIGEFLGTVIGTVLRQVADATKYISGIVEGGGFAGGFASAFDKAGGFSAIQDIFVSIVQLFIKAIGTAITKMPILSATVTALALLPAIIGAAVTSMVERMMSKCVGMAQAGACPMPGGRRGGRGGGAGGGFLGEQRGMRAARLRAMRRARDFGRGAQYAAEPFVNYAATSRVGQGFAKAGRGVAGAVKGAGRFIPGGAVAAGAIDLATSVASGEDFGKAAVGAFGTVLGGAAGSIFGPAGTVIGSIAGGMLADAASDFITGALDQNKAALLQIEAAQKQVAAASESAIAKYGPDYGEKLGGVEALSQALGGGAGVKAYADEQLRLGKITAEQAQNWSILSNQLTQVNTTTTSVQKAQKDYDTAVKLNTGKQKEYKAILEKAQADQKRALANITANWESMSAANRTKLLSGADNIVVALNEAAAKIRGWKGIPAVTPAPPPRVPAMIPPTSNTQAEQRSRGGSPMAPASPGGLAGAAYKGSLGDAISKELRMKPPGSDLLIANSSETVIPAAGGYGMKAFIDTIASGFGAVKNQMQTLGAGLNTVNANAEKRSEQTNTTISDYHNQTQQQILNLTQNVSSLSTQLATMSSMGGMGGFGGGLFGAGMGGGGVGRVIAVGKMLQGMGLNVAENPAFGSGRVGQHAPGSYHYSGRAIDVTGSTAQLNAAYSKLQAMGGYAELLWQVPGHYDHLHVAYALGAGMPAFFADQNEAVKWEKKHLDPGVKSITSNTSEVAGLLDGLFGRKPEIRKPGQKPTMGQLGTETGYRLLERRRQMEEQMRLLGGRTSYVQPGSLQRSPKESTVASAPININSPITIHQQPGQDAEELASIVAIKIGEAVAQARSSSVFV